LELKKAKDKAGIIDAKSFYDRSAENQKLFEKAISATKENKHTDVISIYKQILSTDDKDFVVWTEIGTAYFISGKLSEAENSYKKSIELNDSFLLPQINLAKLFLSKKTPEKAIELLTKSVIKDSKSPDINHYLGEAYLQIKKGSKAVVYLNEAIKLAPIEKAELHLRLAALYNAAGMKDRAVSEYRQFLAKVPNFPDKEDLEKYIKENSPK
jgi:tetratricopeptide (TPR) repeat protein